MGLREARQRRHRATVALGSGRQVANSGTRVRQVVRGISQTSGYLWMTRSRGENPLIPSYCL